MTNTTPNDAVNHPSHYTQYPVEVIELTRHMSFTRGNSVKYIARAGYKGGPEKELEDLKKARWYLEDDIKEVEKKLGIIRAGDITPNMILSKNIQAGSVPILTIPANRIANADAAATEANFTEGLWHGNSDDPTNTKVTG